MGRPKKKYCVDFDVTKQTSRTHVTMRRKTEILETIERLVFHLNIQMFGGIMVLYTSFKRHC